MKKLAIYLKDYVKECILGPLFKLLEAGFDLTVPLVMAAIIDKGIAQNDSNQILGYGGILVLLALVGLVCSITAQYFAAKAAVGFAAKLRHALFEHIQLLSFAEMDTLGTSTLITRMTSDINQMQSGVNMALRLFLRSPFIVFGAAIMAFTIDWKGAMVFTVVIPLLAVVVFGIMLWTMPLFKKVQAGLDSVLSATRQNLNGVRVIRAFNKEDEEITDFSEKNEGLTKLQLFVGRISGLTNPVTYVLINLALVVLLWTSGVRIEIGSLTQGEAIALINYMSQILVELVKLANTIVLTTKAVACAGRVAGVFEMQSSLIEENLSGNDMVEKIEEQKMEDTEKAEVIQKIENIKDTENTEAIHNIKDTQKVKGIENTHVITDISGVSVEFQNVSFTYQGAGASSLENISIKVEPGQTVGIIGATGSGKSTLVHLIPRFYDASEGSVLIDGKDVKSYPLQELREKIGIVMQKAVLFSGTIRENICWGKKDASEEEVIQALKDAQGWEIVQNKEDGLDSKVEQEGRNLSGGQRQRFTIARALVKKPQILILDDSSSALDFATDAKLRKALRELSYHPTIFVVSQRTSSIQHADQIIVLDDGEVAGIGTHEELLASCEEYQQIHLSQYTDSEDTSQVHKKVGEEVLV